MARKARSATAPRKGGRPRTKQEDGGRHRLAPEVRRGQVLEAALAIFSEDGFERATLQRVADRAGVTKGAVYHYFESKDHLFLELMREGSAEKMRTSEALLATAEPGVAREVLVRRLLEAMWTNLQRPQMIALVRLIMTELPKFPEIGRRFFAELVLPARQTMRKALSTGTSSAAAGEVPSLEPVAALLPSMLVGVALSQAAFQSVDPRHPPPEEVGRAVIDVVLRGVLAATEPTGPAAP